MSYNLVLAQKGSPIPFIAEHINANFKETTVKVEWTAGNNVGTGKEKLNAKLSKTGGQGGADLLGEEQVVEKLLEIVAIKDEEIKEYVTLGKEMSKGGFSKFLEGTAKLEEHLKMRSYLVGYESTIADELVWGVLRGSAAFQKNIKANSEQIGENVKRWYKHIMETSTGKAVMEGFSKRVDEKAGGKKEDQGNFELGLKNLEYGKVCTRFPPEPSGYLHIGHAKAALLNEHIAKSNGGRLIVRFDDTNPTKEKEEFEESIVEDLRLLGIKADQITHTSDYFDKLEEYAWKLIEIGKAYVDDTDQATMREQRMHGEKSRCRDLSIEENKARFSEIIKGSEEAISKGYCLRAKISVDDKNKALRDPVIFRINLTPHHRTGTKYKAYPLYDFAVPIVDALEGVTHALRSNEYRDRNPMYYWFIDTLSLRKVQICDFSRLNFVYTLLSKRKLQWFVDQNLVTGWDDPRFPTVRGIRRRGLTISALKQYVLMQGASQNQLLLEWDKLWALNKKVIDPVAPRFTAVKAQGCITATLTGPDAFAAPEQRSLPKHKKNPDLGSKSITYSNEIYLEHDDVSSFALNEEITLMDLGNAFVRSIDLPNNSITLELNLKGDYKLTSKKVTWLSTATSANATLLDYDYLINKPKLDESDDFTSVLTTTPTIFETPALVDPNVLNLNIGDIIQFERKGYFVLDSFTDKSPNFISIPDGKAANLASKSNVSAPAKEKTPKSSKKDSKKDSKKSSKNKSASASAKSTPASEIMYQIDPVLSHDPLDPSSLSSMYLVERYY
ncbi:putative glutamate-tRNA ligase, cytoplasmic [Zancudomyces culisetae]|uniref:glutamate--tRNA ligase n=1 Tax=Zancudomyces culisetae TaxID=1213189 RepID=A0A1R1PC98_ZANCU|nr:putative glutamate-tRNA ligase, cytoplasmic [Zancudomyces culisetae]|eukprot:OMH78605.1 putative glutamate-tRNA ligase, cytoplasmic [Zancudomyces culisetae]